MAATTIAPRLYWDSVARTANLEDDVRIADRGSRIRRDRRAGSGIFRIGDAGPGARAGLDGNFRAEGRKLLHGFGRCRDSRIVGFRRNRNLHGAVLPVGDLTGGKWPSGQG
jgi:hypothetical protein